MAGLKSKEKSVEVRGDWIGAPVLRANRETYSGGGLEMLKVSSLTKPASCRPLNEMENGLSSSGRLEARLPRDVHALIKRAAEMQGRSVTDFVVTAAREEACRTIEQGEIIRLSVEGQRQIADDILNPPEPTEALRRAFERRDELFGPMA